MEYSLIMPFADKLNVMHKLITKEKTAQTALGSGWHLDDKCKSEGKKEAITGILSTVALFEDVNYCMQSLEPKDVSENEQLRMTT